MLVPNYAFERTAEQALRPKQTIAPQPLNVALGVLGDLMGIPAEVVSILKRVGDELPVRNVPLAFWQLDQGKLILDGFMSLASHLRIDEVDLSRLPLGYEIVEVLFGWESDCQFDGWGAFANVGEEEFERICKLFETVGIPDEANSLRSEMEAYLLDSDNMEALNRVADEHRHSLSVDLDRLEFLTQYLCDNAEELLGTHA